MKERKRKEDYSLKTEIDSSGRARQVPVYHGSWYHTPEDKSSALLSAALLPWLLLFWLPMVFYLCLNVPSTRCMYVLLPAILSLVPGFYWGLGLWSFFRSPMPMTRLQKEKGPDRILKSSLGSMVFSAAALTGDLIFIVISVTDRSAEILPVILFSLSASGAVISFIRSRQLYHRFTESSPIPSSVKEAGAKNESESA